MAVSRGIFQLVWRARPLGRYRRPMDKAGDGPGRCPEPEVVQLITAAHAPVMQRKHSGFYRLSHTW